MQTAKRAAVMALDHSTLASELVRALRARRSQRALGRRVGFSSNVIYSWESGRRYPTTSAFFRVAQAVGLDLGPRLRKLLDRPALRITSAQLGTGQGVAMLMRDLAGEQRIAPLARATGVDRTTVTRWLRGSTEPRLPEFLSFVQATTLRLLDLIAIIADPALLPSTSASYRNLLAQRKLAYELPLSHAVLRALELDGYRSAADEVGFIVDRTGLDPESVSMLLGVLASAGQIRRRRGRWNIADVMTIDTRNDPQRDLQLKRHWLDVSRARLDQKRLQASCLFSYNVFAVSSQSYESIRTLHLEYYDRLRQIVANDRNPERVVLTTLQLVPLDE